MLFEQMTYAADKINFEEKCISLWGEKNTAHCTRPEKQRTFCRLEVFWFQSRQQMSNECVLASSQHHKEMLPICTTTLNVTTEEAAWATG